MVVSNDVYFILGAVLGTAGHWAVKWRNGDVDCFMDMARTEVFRTAMSVAVQAIGAVIVLGSGDFQFDSWKAALYAGATAGAAIDAFFNKGKRTEWTHRERTVKRMLITEKGK